MSTTFNKTLYPLSEIKHKIQQSAYRTFKFGSIFTSYLELEYLRRIQKKDNVYIGKWTKDKLISMGTTFIKIGQFMSTRTDIFGEAITDQLKDLYDNVSPLPFHLLKKQISSVTDITDEFQYIQEQPIASASIGQVHVGKLKTGEDIVLKVKRPGIEEQIKDDFEILLLGLHMLGHVSDDRKIKEFEILFSEYYKLLQEEINFSLEADNMKIFKSNFASKKWVTIPKVYEDLSNEDVITMQFIGSNKITDIAFLDKNNLSKEKIAQKFVELFIKQIVEYGIVHIDPHPGNIGITESGKIVFYDFGMVLRLDKNLKDKFSSFIIAVYDKDVDAIASIAIDMGLIVIHPKDISYLKTFLISFLVYIENADIEEFKISYINKINNTSTPFVISSKFVLLLRGISILEGICKQLDPNFNFRKTLNPYIEEFLVDVNYLEARALNDIKILKSVPTSVQEAHVQLEVLEKQMRQIEIDVKSTQVQTYTVFLSVLMTMIMQHEFSQGLSTAVLLGLSYIYIVNGKIHKE
jgi:predicted unusual protein kinase regulating ubiquinone biosynthesis (AarF/ABC1/UbiB family)